MKRYGKVACELPCEMCLKPNVCTTQETVCNACDAEMKAFQGELISARAKAHAAKYKCQSCGKGLPEHRRLKCTKCMELPSEDVIWERMEGYTPSAAEEQEEVA